MTNKEWIDLLSKEFNVSRTSAKDMLHQIMIIKCYDNLKKQSNQRRDTIEKLDVNR